MHTTWIHKVQSVLKESLNIPMWGQIPSFPWESVSNSLKEVLQLPHLSLSEASAEWIDHHHLASELDKDSAIFSLTLSPLTPSFFLVFSKEDLKVLSEYLVRADKSIKSFDDERYQKGLVRYCLLKVIEIINRHKLYAGLSLKMHENSFTKETSYVVNIKVTLDSETNLHLKMICPTSFHKVASSHFIKQPIDLKETSSHLELPLAFKIGQVKLKYSSLHKIHAGDFIILDSCSYEEDRESNHLTMTLFHTPLFIVKTKEDKLKILDFALFEEETNMVEDEDMEEEFEEDEDFEEEEEFEEEATASTATLEPLITSKDIPLTVHVEVAHIKMPLKKLLSLKPGNTLELKVRPEAGVNLIVEGKTIGRGELLQIGDVLGVKVTELASK